MMKHFATTCSVCQTRNFHPTPSFLSKIPKNLKGKSVTSQEWLRRQLNDPYVKLSHKEGYRCRSAFKLLEIDDRFRFMKPGQTVVDCGASPGSWSQVAIKRTNSTGKEPGAVGRVVSVDLQHMPPLEGAIVLSESDFTTRDVQLAILRQLGGRRVDAVISDMAPRASGVRSMDQELIIDLCLAALTFATRVSAPDASFLCKLWQGSDQQRLHAAVMQSYREAKWVKPKASRTDSSELFLLARGFKSQ